MKDRLRRAATASALATHRQLTRTLQSLTPDQQPRAWSNRQIEAIGASVSGDVVHVSAWRDDDKAGRQYRDYFPKARSYVTTNVGGERGESPDDSIHLDLAAPLDPELRRSFDFVLNHTTLEHIYRVEMALENLFAMSRSEILVVVPFMQVEHWENPSYGDYWRIGAHGLTQACLDHRFEIVSLSSNHNPVWPIYYCLHARRRTEEPTTDLTLWTTSGAASGFGVRPVQEGHPLMR